MEDTTFELKSTVEGEVQVQDAFYAVDFSTLTSVNDLVLLLAAMGITFHSSHPHFNSVKKFLALENPIIPPGFENGPKEVPLDLPKLKKE
jgi:hypothetical protein